MAFVKNPDGSITVGILAEPKKETKAAEKETLAPQPAKKPTKKKQ